MTPPSRRPVITDSGKVTSLPSQRVNVFQENIPHNARKYFLVTPKRPNLSISLAPCVDRKAFLKSINAVNRGAPRTVTYLQIRVRRVNTATRVPDAGGNQIVSAKLIHSQRPKSSTNGIKVVHAA